MKPRHVLPKTVQGYDALQVVLREQLRHSEQSVRAIETETGISKTHLANFKNEKRNLSFPNLNALAQHFKIRYVIRNY